MLLITFQTLDINLSFCHCYPCCHVTRQCIYRAQPRPCSTVNPRQCVMSGPGSSWLLGLIGLFASQARAAQGESNLSIALPSPVNGNWGGWSEWSEVPGTGDKLSRKRCQEPAPAYGGLDCSGPSWRVCREGGF